MKMKINERTFLRILREEATHELVGNNNRSVNLGLTLSEVRALRSLGTRASRLNEVDAVAVAVAAAESKYGRKIMVSILKAIKFISGVDVLMLKHIHSPLWQKACDFIERKFDVNIPFTGDEFFDIAKYFAPGHYIGIVIDELVGILNDMSDEDYQDIVKKKKKEEPEPVNRKDPSADNTRPMLPEPLDERRIRALVLKELSHPRR